MATTVNYQCPHCSAPLSFIPGNKTVTCEYCGNEFEIAAIEKMFEEQQKMAAKELDAQNAKWDTAEAGGEWSQDEIKNLRALTCSACGAELVCDENTMATECCYCGNPTMVPQRFSGMLKPDLVIPFKKSKQEAVAALKKFYEGKKLLPDAFTANNRVESIQPMYVPFWLFDSTVEAHLNVRAEKDRVRENSSERITETSVYNCTRGGTMRFEKIPADGSKKMNDTYMESIEPFDYSELEPFSAAYFTGYLADKYDVTAEESVSRTDKRLEETAIDLLAQTVQGYDRVRPMSHAIIKQKSKVIYAMVPVWILTTRYENQPYTFMMNGQTGKFVGSLPSDSSKAFKYSAAATLISFPILYFLISMLT